MDRLCIVMAPLMVVRVSVLLEEALRALVEVNRPVSHLGMTVGMRRPTEQCARAC